MAERRGTILLVDDDGDVREYMTAALGRAGYAVIEAADGVAALERLRDGTPIDLLLTDIRMPGIGGIELARRAAELRPGLKMLFVSGYASEFAQGVPDPRCLIMKPIGARDLVRRVQSKLRH
jgi:CheY-like chemotaxis protein